jgi:hypothetical protein
VPSTEYAFGFKNVTVEVRYVTIAAESMLNLKDLSRPFSTVNKIDEKSAVFVSNDDNFAIRTVKREIEAVTTRRAGPFCFKGAEFVVY